MNLILQRLMLSNIRNIKSIDLTVGPKFNFFLGKNGSGKTSLLEAIHLLSMGKSFRSRSAKQVISFGEKKCLIRGMLVNYQQSNPFNIWLAVEKNVNGNTNYKLGEKNQKSSVEFTRTIPIQLIDINSHLLIEGGPNNRRRFIDWGLFYADSGFLHNWRNMQKALKQRNAALKLHKLPDNIWEESFIKYAEVVNNARIAYLDRFKKKLLNVLSNLMDLNSVSLEYRAGWDVNQGLLNHMRSNSSLDLIYGYTSCGPHKADISILINGKPAKEVLSRGQTKIFACSLLLARTKMLSNTKQCIFLIDDLHSELDFYNCKALISAIDSMNCQTFISSIEEELVNRSMDGLIANIFHIDNGQII